MFFISVFSITARASGAQPVTRFAIIAGSGYGGEDRDRLKYASKDAELFTQVFSELGGIRRENIIVLEDPDPGRLFAAFKKTRGIISNDKSGSKRTESIFYYSGHSDNKGLILNGGTVPYDRLKQEIRELPSDIKIAILDSCSSGQLIRLKGGERVQPFMLDNAIDLTGYAFLSSSSETEASQESDSIRGSFFTHCLISGLRGAADTDGNSRITLNEAYQYAFRQTLSMTGNYNSGLQHPVYDIQMKGSGDLVLTDINSAASGLRIEDVTGKVCIFDNNSSMIAELDNKSESVTLGLSPGAYSITWEKDEIRSQAHVLLTRDNTSILRRNSFTVIKTGFNDKPSSYGINKFSVFLQPLYSTVYGDLKDNLKPDAGMQITGNFDISGFSLNPAIIFGFQMNNPDNLSVFYTTMGLGYQQTIYRKFNVLLFFTGGFSTGKFELKQEDEKVKKISYSQSIFLPGINLFYNLNRQFSLSLSAQCKYFLDDKIVFGTYDVLFGIGYRI